jgi:hypothetical protein
MPASLLGSYNGIGVKLSRLCIVNPSNPKITNIRVYGYTVTHTKVEQVHFITI